MCRISCPLVSKASVIPACFWLILCLCLLDCSEISVFRKSNDGSCMITLVGGWRFRLFYACLTCIGVCVCACMRACVRACVRV